jgi:malonyl CoA-acyl carrier protein transacylase
MGQELLGYSTYRKEILAAGDYLHSLGCPWSAIGKLPCVSRLLVQARRFMHANISPQEELCRTESESNIDKPDFGQPLITILQIAVVNLLKQFGIQPSAVVGHSSGEIAAA